MNYASGDLIRFYGTFSVTGILTDPSIVTGKLKPPTGATMNFPYGSSAQLVRDATGQYHFDYLVNLTGTWYYRFEGSGVATVADEGSVVVNATQF